MAELTPIVVVEAGIASALVGVDPGGDSVINRGDILLHVKNSNGSTRTVTVTAQKTIVNSPGMGDTVKSDVAALIPATNGDMLIGPFPPLAFNDASGKLVITYSADAGLTIAAYRLPRPA